MRGGGEGREREEKKERESERMDLIYSNYFFFLSGVTCKLLVTGQPMVCFRLNHHGLNLTGKLDMTNCLLILLNLLKNFCLVETVA